MKIDTSSYYPKSPLDDMESESSQKKEESNSMSDSLYPNEKVFSSEDIPLHEETSPDSHESAERITESSEKSGEYHHESSHNNHGSKDIDPAAPIDILATALSWILVPLMMPVYGIMLIFTLSLLQFNPYASKVLFTSVIFGINMLLPVILIIILKKVGYVKDIGLNNRNERPIPYIITIVCMAGSALFLYFKGAPLWVAMFFAGGALAAAINLTVNFKWKISAHAAGIAGVVAMLLHLLVYENYSSPSTIWWLISFILLAGLLGSARIWLGRHTLAQVMAGYAVGFCSVYFLSMIG